MKKLALILSLLIITLSSSAQTNFYKLRIGAGAGGALAFADVQKKTLTVAAYGTIDYLATPFLSLGAEVQKGELAGGDILFDTYNRQFINSYMSATVNLKLSFGEFMSDYQRKTPFLNFLSGVYGGIGLGVIKNKISNVRYYGDIYYPGLDSSTDEVMPVNLGVDINFPNKWGYNTYSVNINLQSNLTFGEGMDGYDPGNGKGAFDMYGYFSVGFKYHFGFMGLDKRR